MSTKRSSIDDDFTPQLKRLSFDESKSYKQSVYDKTMKILFEGARYTFSSITVTRTPQHSKRMKESENKYKLKQVLLDNNCQLDNKNFIYNPAEYSSVLSEKCTFCERLHCFTTLYQCIKCREHFCSNCSLSTYANNQDSFTCLSCLQ